MTELKSYCIKVNSELWKQFNIRTAEEGTNKSAKIRELIDEYLGIQDEEDEHKDYKEIIEGRVHNNTIYYHSIEYISMKTGVNIDEIIDFIKYETNYLINYEGK